LQYANILRDAKKRLDHSSNLKDYIPDDMLLDALADVARSFVDSEKVPSLSPTSSTGRRSSSHRHKHKRSIRDSTTPEAGPHQAPLPPPSPTPLQITRHSSPTPKVEVSDREPIVTPEGAREASENVRAVIRGDDYVSVQPRENILKLDLSKHHQSISGYISTGINSFKSATALVDPDLEDNIISQLYANTLGLEIHPLDPDDVRTNQSIAFKDGREVHKVGDTTLTWGHAPSSHKKVFPVHCSVYEYNIKPLIFGQRFLKKRQHYWGRGKEEIGDIHHHHNNDESGGVGSARRM
jgi:hypothetical protein